MQILDVLTGAQDGAAAGNLARAFNIEPKAAEAALEALVPQLTRSMERNTLSNGGLADLVEMLGQGDRQRYLQPETALASDDARADGNAILEQILGSKNASRKAAERAARETGLDENLLKQLLPAVAGLVMGGVSKQTAGAFGDIFQKLGIEGSPLPLPGEPPRPRAPSVPSGDADDWRPRAPSSGGGGSIKGKNPLPIPGDDLPGLGRGGRGGGGLDDLSDVIRRGGRGIPGRSGGDLPVPGGAGGGTLWSIIRSILGGVLGFESKGFLGWLVRLIVIRWGWGFLKRILTRVLTRR